ncbi:hypothetical protein UG54_01280 [Gordonia sihwensis]|nr:hypothetical protein UG54_01280 [Gordonia sihwensis]
MFGDWSTFIPLADMVPGGFGSSMEVVGEVAVGGHIELPRKPAAATTVRIGVLAGEALHVDRREQDSRWIGDKIDTDDWVAD